MTIEEVAKGIFCSKLTQNIRYGKPWHLDSYFPCVTNIPWFTGEYNIDIYELVGDGWKVSLHLSGGKRISPSVKSDVVKVEIEGEEALGRLLTVFRLAEPEQSERFFV